VVRIRAVSAAVANNGSGIMADDSRRVLTNYHVFEGDETPVRAELVNTVTVKVGLSDGRWLDGSVTGPDRESDLAAVSVDLDGLATTELGLSYSLEVGDELVAVGYLLNLNGDEGDSLGPAGSGGGRPVWQSERCHLRGVQGIRSGAVADRRRSEPGQRGRANRPVG
jgi:hypothetical protein